MIKKDDLSPLVEKEAATKWLIIIAGVALAISVFLSIGSIFSIISILRDKTIPVVNCPSAYEVDAPVFLQTIKNSSPEEKDKWVKGFIRRYIQAQFPRNDLDSREQLTYIINHSKGAIQERYSSYLSNIDHFNSLLNQGFYYAFYPENSLNVRVRSTNKKNQWVVEIDGYLIRYAGTQEERTTPTLRYTVVAGDHTMTNPEGLYVIESNIIALADYVSGRGTR